MVVLSGSKHSVVADIAVDDDIALVTRLLAAADAVVWSRGSQVAEHPRFTPETIHQAHPHLTVNRELLGELGLSPSEIEELEADGVIGSAPAMYAAN